MIENMPNISPLVTFAVISYNHERFIAEALESALAQTYSPLEVVVSDDFSTDATFSVIANIASNYTGPHKIIIHRNAYNLGLAENVNKVWELSSGELVIFQGGDDISLPHRTSKLVEAWMSREPRPDLVYSGVVRIDEDGNVISKDTIVVEKTPSIDDTITGRKVFIAGGCVAAYSRSLHFFVGPLSGGVIAEDFVYSFRALLGNGVAGISEPLVLYRQHSESIIGQLKSTLKVSGRVDDKYLKAHVVKLVEYKRAMDAYKVKRPYLRWMLDRQVKSFEMELCFGSSKFVKKWLFIFWALSSLRIRLLRKMLSILTESSTVN
ncbi:glycosyl transferase family 2 [Sulfuricella sp. T08]|uniref:glycosyltransferase n=1 Tax=Sulfuricella sp. T08 TaxID=1632857 RepID=UPI0006179F05|nr:glycosyltransferase [Sulfuricella sp. T08]GAO34679.1 glycosyl transferase family 2 [Sulfuricella sp. T08]